MSEAHLTSRSRASQVQSRLAMRSHTERVFTLANEDNVLSRVLDVMPPARAIFQEYIHELRHRVAVHHNAIEFAELQFVELAFLKLHTAFRQTLAASAAIRIHAGEKAKS